MAITYIDLIDGNTGQLTINGWQLDRKVIVDGLTGTTPHQRIYEAWLATGVHLLDAHPTITDAYLRNVSFNSVSGNQVEMILHYEQFPYNEEQISIQNSGQTEETAMDYDNKQIVVSYSYPPDYKGNPERAADQTPVQQLKKVEKLVDDIVISVTRSEVYPLFDGGKLITDRAQEYVGTVNKAGWNLRPNDPVHTWRCTSINGVSSDNGLSYQVTYQFQYKKKTWKQYVYYIDPETGDYPPDILAQADAFKLVQIYAEKDFTLLGLS